MNQRDPNVNYNKLQLSLYLLPVLGTFLALVDLWKLSGLKQDQRPSPQSKTISLSIKLGVSWLILYSGLWWGSSISSDVFAFRLLYLNGLLTTSYFFACGYFLWKIWQKRGFR